MLVKRNTKNFNETQVIWILLIFALLYVIFSYIVGLYFGFYTSINKFSINNLFFKIIPIAIIIIAMEYTRSILIVQKIKAIYPLTLITMLLIDMSIYSGMFNFNTLYGFLGNFGYIFLSSLSLNILYNYISINISYFKDYDFNISFILLKKIY